MPNRSGALSCSLVAVGLLVTGCGDDAGGDPTEIMLGETTFVTIVNPAVNEATDAVVPEPGTARSDVRVEADGGGPSVRTDEDGVGVLSPVEAGSRTLSMSGEGIDGSLVEGIADRDLVELAIAGEGDRVERMARVVYAFGADVVELAADTPISEVNDALANSNRIVLLEGGTYEGDLEFSGSDVTLFGEGVGGGRVFIDGNVEVGGSGNRIRGATITGGLDVSGSDFGMSFSRVEGDVVLGGSDATLLQSGFCGSVDVGGSNIVALGNRGMAPVPAPADCP
ncbi:MAG: hypothetical protein ACOC97_04040 [Myxococcota bacterium]